MKRAPLEPVFNSVYLFPLGFSRGLETRTNIRFRVSSLLVIMFYLTLSDQKEHASGWGRGRLKCRAEVRVAT